ncbi:MAG: penicillin acylase family protein [Spirochaetaceae bacterium]
MTKRSRILTAILVPVALVVVATLVALLVVTRRPHPKTSGSVEVPDVETPVEVLRDENGVPHIYAESPEDMYRAQGYVHAQDRFWQMDFRRRLGEGRLSELFGETALSTDVFIRTMGFADLAREEYRRAPKEVRSALDAYAEGVNAYIAERSAGRLSLEHALLSLRGTRVRIEPWEPAHTLTWLKIMSYDLGQNLQTELDTLRLVRAVGTEAAADLFPAYRDKMPYTMSESELRQTAADSPVPVAATDEAQSNDDRRAVAAGVSSDIIPKRLSGIPADLGFGEGGGLGSNSWVLGGSRTESGQPLLANDPHLGVDMPSIWYEVSLHNGQEDRDVAGYSFAGVPGVVVGHNDRIAWGVTNLSPDVQDLFIERINPADPLQYEVNGEWRDMKVRTEEIEVSGKREPHVIRVRETRHGPLITDLESNAQFREFNVGPPRFSAEALAPTELSLQWTALEPNRTMESVHRLNRASDFEEFREAVSRFDVPAQNFLYADVDGNIGYQAPGRIPIRRKGSGRLPAPGWTDEYRWEGYIPFEELPYVLNPEKDYIATANNPVVPPDAYPHFIAEEFNHGYRARRIVDLIEQAPGEIDADYVAAMQGDTYSISAAEILPHVLDLEPEGLPDSSPGRTPETSPEALGRVVSAAQRMLSTWDGDMDRESPGAALFALFFQNLVRETFTDQIPEGLWEDSPALTEGSRLQSALAGLLENPDNVWWDDVRTPETREERDDILRRALIRALEQGARLFEAPLPEWRWGELHTVEFRHQTLGDSGIGLIEDMFNRGPHAVDGGTEQVLAADWDLTDPYEVNWITSMRQIIDLSDLDASRMMHTTGQSGHPFHTHYDNMIDAWLNLRFHEHHFSREEAERSSRERLILRPPRS